MRINSINSALPTYKKIGVKKVNQKQVQTNGQFKVISLSEYMARPLSFKARNKEQAIFYGAEADPYSKAGGVGTVMKDYATLLEPKNEVVVTPYYKGIKDPQTGKMTPQKDNDGDYVLLDKNSNPIKLELVAEKEMQWGKTTDNRIMLFRKKDDDNRLHYFVFDETTSGFSKPYENVPVYSSGAKAKTNAWNGDPYAKNSKAFVELLPELIKDKDGFNPATIVCSDAQTAYTHEYVVQKAVKDEKGYEDIKTTHIGHNLGPGYCGETSMQNMFVNLGATPEQIKEIEADPVYQQRILGDKYFKPFVEETLDSTGTASATQIALHHASKDRANGEGFVKAFSVVAEDYAKSIATNPQAAHNIYESVKPLYDAGVFNGILNPLEDVSVDPTKPLPNTKFNEDCVDTDGKVYPKFEVYPADVSYEEMRRIKNGNKAKLLERLSAKDVTIITGNAKKNDAKINPEAKVIENGKEIYSGPVIRPELIEMIKEGKGDQVPLFVSWGRIDTQKGHDIALSAFEKFAQTEKGKNAILILGAGYDKGDESKRIQAKIQEMLKNPALQGRLVHIDGWAPAYALASAGDAAIFTSRFEPCGLTDIEAMKYYCTPIVVNTQGFKQKNFDPRVKNEAAKATSYKTQHEYNLLKSQVNLIIDGYVKGDEDAKAKAQAEFPVFKTKNGYDSTPFETFADGYKKFIEAKKHDLIEEHGSEEALPENWDDWDELSKDYSFKYTNFARVLKDEILARETAEAMKSLVTATPKTKGKIFENLKALDTTWKGNGKLHPDTGKSSYELYREHHMMSDYSKPVASDVIAKDTDFIKAKIESTQKQDMGERIKSYALGALTGLAGLLFSKTKSAEYSGQDELKKTIETLKGQETGLQEKIGALENQLKEQAANFQSKIKANNKKMILVGIAAAVGAGVLTFIGTKLYAKKAKKNEPTTQQNPPAATTVNQPAVKVVTPVIEKPVQATVVPFTTQTQQKVANGSSTNFFADFNKFAQ